jgi:tetratricopeptide (TPR) repeat protein
MKRILFLILCVSLMFTGIAKADVSANLILAARDGNLVNVNAALTEGADINAKMPPIGRTALIWASEQGHVEVVKLLLQKGANVDEKNFTGGTALMAALEQGQIEIIKLLIGKGADVNIKDINGATPLRKAKEMGRSDIMELLENAGAKEDNSPYSEGQSAVIEQYINLVQSNRMKDAEKILDEWVAVKPDDHQRWSVKAMLEGDAGQWAEAAKSFDKLTKLEPNNAGYWTGKGQCLAALNRNAEALEAFDKALNLDPKSVDSLYNRACMYARIGDKTNAIADLKKAIELEPSAKKHAQEDADFESLRSDPDFNKTISLP